MSVTSQPTHDSPEGPVLFFDGVCGFCNRTVDLSLKWDRRGRIRFAPLQGTTAASLLPDEDVNNLDTVVFYENGTLSRRSTAVVGLLKNLGGVSRLLATLLWVIPRPLRDWGYRLIARNRYRLFGQKDTCRLPTPEERARFLD